jgi:hypothetical protein
MFENEHHVVELLWRREAKDTVQHERKWTTVPTLDPDDP